MLPLVRIRYRKMYNLRWSVAKIAKAPYAGFDPQQG
jgi:hypothetical protein